MKRTVLLFITLLFVMITVRAQVFTIGNLSYSVINGAANKVSVAAADQNITGHITIPATVTNGNVTYTVADIGYAINEGRTSVSFANCSRLTSVSIPNSVTSIGFAAFRYCSSLTSVSIPNSVTGIGNAAFFGCSSLASITIPNSVTAIDRYAFCACTNLVSIIIPGGITKIEDNTFQGCSRLTSVSIPENVTGIGFSFDGCTALQTVEANMIRPPGISSTTFRSVDLSKVKLIVPGGTVAAYQSAGWSIFGVIEINPNTPTRFIIDASGVLTQYTGTGGNIVIPNEVKSIGGSVFKNNTAIASVVIPEGVTAIGSEAFAGCTALRTVEAKMTRPPNISSGIFQSADLSKVKLIVPGGTVAAYQSAGWNIFSIIEINPNTPTRFIIDASGVLTQYVGLGGNVVIPGEVKSIANAAFQKNTTIISIVIPEGVTGIGNNAFAGCTALRTVEAKMTQPPGISSGTFQSVDLSKVKLIIPGSALGVYQSAGWTGFGIIETDTGASIHFVMDASGVLTRYIGPGGDIVIPDEVKSIGNNVFRNNTGITSIVIPEGVTAIGREAFAGCTALQTVEAKMLQPPYLYADVFSGVDLNNVKLIVLGGTATAYQSASVWSHFGTIEMNPNTPTRFVINDYGVLTQYIGLGGDIVIPDEVKSIAASAFQNNTTITSVVIPNSVTNIGANTFYGCYSLISVSIPNSVTSIGGSAFQSCNSLTYITIPNSVTGIGSGAFQNCLSLTSVTIPNSITGIESSTFYGCSGLIKVELPNSLESIGNSAFSDCSYLSTVTIPNGITAIGNNAFTNCTGLKSVEVKWFEPLTVSAAIFSGVDLSSVKLVVPVGAKTNYQRANVWSNFGNIEEYGSGTDPDPDPDPNPGPGGNGFAGGTGTVTDPYRIATAQQFAGLREYLGRQHAGKYFKLTNNISLSAVITAATGWEPLGTTGSPFAGHLDGAGHKVTGLWMNRTAGDYTGLFGAVVGSIEGLGVETDGAREGVKGRNYTGALAGSLLSGGSIRNCHAAGNVSGSLYAGGLTGGNSGSIAESYADVDVTAARTGNAVGGLTGSSGGSITNCYAVGSVSGTGSDFGGLAGTQTAGSITTSYAAGAVTGGGLVGRKNGSITNCYYLKADNSQKGVGNSLADDRNVTGLTVDRMMSSASFTGFNFSTVWNVNEGQGYPFLRSAGVPTSNDERPTATPLQAYATSGTLHIRGLTVDKRFDVYNIRGQPVCSSRATSETQTVTLPSVGIYIVTTAGQSVKVIYRK